MELGTINKAATDQLEMVNLSIEFIVYSYRTECTAKPDVNFVYTVNCVSVLIKAKINLTAARHFH